MSKKNRIRHSQEPFPVLDLIREAHDLVMAIKNDNLNMLTHISESHLEDAQLNLSIAELKLGGARQNAKQ